MKTGAYSLWTCNAIYQDSDKAHIFCIHYLSNKHLWMSVCQTYGSRVSAGFVKTVACTPPKNEKYKKKRTKKIGEGFSVQKHGKPSNPYPIIPKPRKPVDKWWAINWLIDN